MPNLYAAIASFVVFEILDVVLPTLGLLLIRMLLNDNVPQIPIPPSRLDVILFSLADPVLFQPFSFLSAYLSVFLTLNIFRKTDGEVVALAAGILVLTEVLLSPVIFPNSSFRFLTMKLPASLFGFIVIGLRASDKESYFRSFLQQTSVVTVLLWVSVTSFFVLTNEIKPIQPNPELETFEEMKARLPANETSQLQPSEELETFDEMRRRNNLNTR